MSKIQLMGSGAYDISCPVKRVFFRPSTAADTIRVGDQVCYNSDSVQDHKERTADPSHLGLTQDTYAEGEQEFTGRLFIVEKPATANLAAYAGVVKSLGEKIGGDGDMIEIFIPTEGAIVPVISDQNCTNERTVLGIRDGAYEASYPGRAVGIARETKDRSGTDGLVWMEFKRFAWEVGDDRLRIEDEAAANNVIIHKMHYRSLQTGGSFTVLEIDARCDGGGGVAAGGQGIAIQANAQIDTTVTTAVTGSVFQLNFTDGTPTENITALQVKLMANSDVTMSSAGRVSALTLTLQVENSVTANQLSWIYLEENGAEEPSQFIQTVSLIDFPAVAFTGSTTINTDSYGIKVHVQGVQYYIPMIPKLQD